MRIIYFFNVPASDIKNSSVSACFCSSVLPVITVGSKCSSEIALSAILAAVTASAPRAVVSTSPAVKCSLPTTSSAIFASVTASAFILAVVTALI